jgi:hypothetical protein
VCLHIPNPRRRHGIVAGRGRRTTRAASRWKQVAAGAEASTAASWTSPAAAPPPASNELIRSTYGTSQQALEKSNSLISKFSYAVEKSNMGGTNATLAVLSQSDPFPALLLRETVSPGTATSWHGRTYESFHQIQLIKLEGLVYY